MNIYDPTKNGGFSRQFTPNVVLNPDLRVFNTPTELSKVMNRIQEVFNVCSKIKSQPQSFLTGMDRDYYYSLVADLYKYAKYIQEVEYDPKNEDAIVSQLKVKYSEYLTNLIRKIGIHKSFDQLQNQIYIFITVIKAIIDSHIYHSEEPIYKMIFFYYYASHLNEIIITDDDDLFVVFSRYFMNEISLQDLEDQLSYYSHNEKLAHLNLIISFTKGDDINALQRLKTFVVELFG